MTIRDAVASVLRTYVPIGVGLVLTLLARKLDIVIDDSLSTSLTTGLAALVAAVYYAGVRLLEARFPKLGWLLGFAVPPQYSKNTGSSLGGH
jgi:hypothetical protein